MDKVLFQFPVSRAMTLSSIQMALSKIMACKGSSNLSPRVTAALHVVLTLIYLESFKCAQLISEIRLSLPDEHIFIRDLFNEMTSYATIRDKLHVISFYPYGWHVIFECEGDDSWVDSVHFPLSRRKLVAATAGALSTKEEYASRRGISISR